ncbi:MAG: hypothetical protein CVU44_06930 [Chloroflexi bacterium HGW-Chloroflexi-6]|nr:MAG: hypothetical protein CVU44_06930 [Chloroflexi bacterium HGW-Chloroflexi-6]
MNRGKLVVIVLLAIVLIAVGAWLGRRVLAIHYQVRGGQELDEVIRTFNEWGDVPIACTLIAPVDSDFRARLGAAVSYLEISLSHDPKLAQAYLLLGRAYCLMGEYQKAIAAYRAFTGLRPRNPLGHLELAFAYQKSMAEPSGSELSADELRALILTELSAAGVDPTQLIPEAGNALFCQKNRTASGLFEMAISLGVAMSSSDELLWDMLTIVNDQRLPQRDGLTSLPVYTLADFSRIEAEDMIWLGDGEIFGKPMSNFSSSNGIFWWNGASVFVVKVVRPGEFLLILTAQNTPPAPVNLQIEHNFAPILNFELIRQDMSWQEFETDLYLDIGLHLISVRFTNYSYINGIGRSAVVDWLKLERK